MHSNTWCAPHLKLAALCALAAIGCSRQSADRTRGADSGATGATTSAAAAPASQQTAAPPRAAPQAAPTRQTPQVDAKNVGASITYDAAAKTATIPIVSGLTSNAGGWNFNGYARGQMTITVPLGTKVVMRFYNDDIVPHSLLVVAGSPAHVPSAPGEPAFSGAATNNPQAGQMTGQQDEMSFTADKAGQYLIVCGVPGHAASGMWDLFQVSASAKKPSVKTS